MRGIAKKFEREAELYAIEVHNGETHRVVVTKIFGVGKKQIALTVSGSVSPEILGGSSGKDVKRTVLYAKDVFKDQD